MSAEFETVSDDKPLSEAELLEEMIIAIVDHPENVRIDEQIRDNALTLTIHTDLRDCGKVIGKAGRTISAIRTFLNVVAFQSQRYVTVNMADERSQQIFKAGRSDFHHRHHTPFVNRTDMKVPSGHG